MGQLAKSWADHYPSATHCRVYFIYYAFLSHIVNSIKSEYAELSKVGYLIVDDECASCHLYLLHDMTHQPTPLFLRSINCVPQLVI